jgi:hypothetical protein
MQASPSATVTLAPRHRVPQTDYDVDRLQDPSVGSYREILGSGANAEAPLVGNLPFVGKRDVPATILERMPEAHRHRFAGEHTQLLVPVQDDLAWITVRTDQVDFSAKPNRYAVAHCREIVAKVKGRHTTLRQAG